MRLAERYTVGSHTDALRSLQYVARAPSPRGLYGWHARSANSRKPPATKAKKDGALDRTIVLSDEVLKSLESGQRAAIDAVRKFVDTVDEKLPALGDRPPRRQEIVDSAMETADGWCTRSMSSFATWCRVLARLSASGRRKVSRPSCAGARGDPWGRAPRRWRCAPIGFSSEAGWTGVRAMAARQASLRSCGSVFLSMNQLVF